MFRLLFPGKFRGRYRLMSVGVLFTIIALVAPAAAAAQAQAANGVKQSLYRMYDAAVVDRFCVTRAG